MGPIGTCASCGARDGELCWHPATARHLCVGCYFRAVSLALVKFVNGSEPPKPTECYRCWQVGRYDVKATSIVVYNVGTEHEWRSPSCQDCVETDGSHFPSKVRVIMRLVEGEKGRR